MQAATPVSRPKRNWHSALHDASRTRETAESPTGLGVRARQRRFLLTPGIECNEENKFNFMFAFAFNGGNVRSKGVLRHVL